MKNDARNNLEVSEKQRYKRCGSVRYVLCVLVFTNCLLLFAMRLNLSVTITAMVNSTISRNVAFSNDTCKDPNFVDNTTTSHSATGEFYWSQKEQAMITYAFFVGYLISQVPGGYLAQTYSFTWVLGLGLGFTSMLTCFTELAARKSLYALVTLRAFEGLCEGVMFPSMFVFTAKWVPLQEQGLLLTFISSGAYVGTVLTMPLSALLSNSALGWPGSFYVFGAAGVVFCALWFATAADGPEYHRWISPAERNYILENRPPTMIRRSEAVPWKQMLSSPAVLFLLTERLASSVNYLMIVTELPSYLKDIFGTSIIDNGSVTGAMIMGTSITLVICGCAADKILAKKIASKSFVRRSSVAISCLVPSLCMFIVPLVGCNNSVILALIFINCVCIGFSGSGGILLPLDIAPKYAGTLQGIVGCIGASAGILAPLLVGFLTEGNNTRHQWNLAFYCIAIVSAVSATLFLLFGSTDEQPWAENERGDDAKDNRAALRRDSVGHNRRRR